MCLALPVLLLLQLYPPALSAERTVEMPPRARPPPNGRAGVLDCKDKGRPVLWGMCDDALQPVLKAVFECEPGYGFLAWPDKLQHTQDDGQGLCLPCKSGFYSAGGFASCRPCGVAESGFVTPSGASRAEQCFCQAGFGGVTCSKCPAGTYSTGGTLQDPRAACSPCPANTMGSSDGATSAQQCGGCLAGFGGSNCQPCAANTYSEGRSYSPCALCGPHQVSGAMSTSAEACGCAPGRGGSSCELCAPNSFSSGGINASGGKVGCTECPPNHMTLSSGATSPAECVCKPGFAGPLCSQCGPGQICPGSSKALPASCPANSVAAAAAPAEGAVRTLTASDCLCKPGYGRIAVSPREGDAVTPVTLCEMCPAGHYNSDGAGSCRRCPEGTTSDPGSTAVDSCACKPGFALQGGRCELCAVGTYSGSINGSAASSCVACRPGQTTLQPGSTSSTDCVCAVGHGSDDASPQACRPCKYPRYQGHLDDNLVPVTSATKANPFPRCQVCNVGHVSASSSVSVVGNPSKQCLVRGQDKGAYCVRIDAPTGNPALALPAACATDDDDDGSSDDILATRFDVHPMTKLQPKVTKKHSADKHDHMAVGEEQKHDNRDTTNKHDYTAVGEEQNHDKRDAATKHEEEPEGAVEYNIHRHGLRPSKNKHEKKEGATHFHHRGLQPSDEARLAVIMAEADDYDDAGYAEEQN